MTVDLILLLSHMANEQPVGVFPVDNTLEKIGIQDPKGRWDSLGVQFRFNSEEI